MLGILLTTLSEVNDMMTERLNDVVAYTSAHHLGARLDAINVLGEQIGVVHYKAVMAVRAGQDMTDLPEVQTLVGNTAMAAMIALIYMTGSPEAAGRVLIDHARAYTAMEALHKHHRHSRAAQAMREAANPIPATEPGGTR